jgi:hypothetical protein
MKQKEKTELRKSSERDVGGVSGEDLDANSDNSMSNTTNVHCIVARIGHSCQLAGQGWGSNKVMGRGSKSMSAIPERALASATNLWSRLGVPME